jgi:polar amino acid transport system substrate-binding protein
MTISKLRTRFICTILIRSAGAMLVLAAPAAQAQNIASVAICEDENEWPPYSYFLRAGGQRTRQVVGYAVDVIDEIFKRHQISYRIDMIPWTRCMAVAALGKEYQMVFNLSYNQDRVKNFLFSRAYYATTTYYFYSRKNNPQGLAITKPADVKKYRICGVRGYNYAGYGLAAGDVDQGSNDFGALIAKMQLGRCALFLEKLEVMAGYGAIGKDYLADPDIGKAPVPGMRPTLFYYGVSRNYPQAASLMATIDEELLRMEASGRLFELWNKAMPRLARTAMTP